MAMVPNDKGMQPKSVQPENTDDEDDEDDDAPDGGAEINNNTVQPIMDENVEEAEADKYVSGGAKAARHAKCA